MKELNYHLMEEEKEDNLNQQSEMLPRSLLEREKGKKRKKHIAIVFPGLCGV